MIALKTVIEWDIKSFEEKAAEYRKEVEENRHPDNTEYFNGKSDAYDYAARKLKCALDWYFGE